MALNIDISKPSFAARSNTAGAAGNATERPKATLWLNVGYTVPVVVTNTDGSTETREEFISLPMGLAVDTMEPVKTNSSNVQFAALQAAKNELLKQIIAAGQQLAPGQAEVINLQLQLRRVNDEAAIALQPDVNPYVMPLNLFGKDK